MRKREPAGAGDHDAGATLPRHGLVERVDDCCATAFVMCERPQAVPWADPSFAVADIGRLPYEEPLPQESSSLEDAMNRASDSV